MKRSIQFAALACLAFAQCLCAQQFPTKPIRVIVSYPAGGGVDLLARAVSQKMSENLGQQVIVENRPGGNTNIAAEYVARSPADGYTLFQPLDATMTMNPALIANLPYDPVKDFAAISRLANPGTLLVASTKLPARTVKELLDYAKANPGKLNYGATAASTQLVAYQLQGMSAPMVWVNYKGTAPMVTALITSEIDFVVDGVSIYVPQIKEGKLRPIATFGPVRDILLPDVPTMREQGFPQFERKSWLALFAPAGTPLPVIQKLNAAARWALAQPDTREKLLSLGLTPNPSTPEELAADLKADLAKWTPLIRAAGLKLD